MVLPGLIRGRERVAPEPRADDVGADVVARR